MYILLLLWDNSLTLTTEMLVNIPRYEKQNGAKNAQGKKVPTQVKCIKTMMHQ